MKITTDKIKIKGVQPGPANPLPMFSHRERNKPSSFDDTFLEKDKKLFAHETGFRVLPYKMQDNYSRNRQEIELDVIDLENENLLARFLPAYGGRLISLYDKKQSKELLFSNSVFQPANLATRDAWFAGGIEWNISQFGHSYLTCEPMFFARITDGEGNDFLRMYEYERNRRIFFSVDFHLPTGATQLGAHVRIVNDNDRSIPMYWWTNIAIREEKDVRVFSGSDQVIYIKPESNESEKSIHQFGRGSITNLPSLPGKDASMPMNFTFSSEYFFQNPEETESPWEAAAYNDGHLFYERSTNPLLYRKMFCWGMHKGGRNWCDFLSEPGKGDYLEIQAGLAPTQLHGLIMEGNATWQFTQIFGSSQIGRDQCYRDWTTSRNTVKAQLDNLLPSHVVEERDQFYRTCSILPPGEILHNGSGWGALEREYRNIREGRRSLPEGFDFPDSTLGDEQKSWLNLLRNGDWGIDSELKINPSWMVDERWAELLIKLSANQTSDPRSLIHLGIISYEQGKAEEAVKYWQDSLAVDATALAWRNIAIALQDWDQPDQALDAMRRAVTLRDTANQVYLIRELMEMLITGKLYDEAWKYYKTLPLSEAMDERIIIPAAMAAFHRDEREFLEKVFSHHFANIKEGETRLADLWYLYKARLLSESNGSKDSAELLKEVRGTLDPPSNIDFTMTKRD